MSYKNNPKEKQKKKEYYLKNKEKILIRIRRYGKKWYQNNKEKIQLLHRKYYRANKEKVLQYHKEWYQKNRERVLSNSKKYYEINRTKVQIRHRNYNKINKKSILRYKINWQKVQRKINPKYRLDANMGSAVWSSLRNRKRGRRWKNLLNYSLEELIKHLENQFDNKMNWNNYGSYWAVDHIKPRSLFNYKSHNNPQFKQCWSLNNLQPLEKIENIKKRNNFIN